MAEAASASSALLSSYSAHDSSTAKGAVSTPYGTGVPTKAAPYPTGEASETTPSGPVGTGFTTKGEVVYPTASGSESVVLTYTLGSGTSTTVVTTTIKHTQTATVYATKPASPEESGSENAGVPTYGAASASSDSLTTTITGTSTSTRYITVLPATSATGTLGAAGSAECVPVTVTVTQATATVTVVSLLWLESRRKIYILTFLQTAPAYSTGANSGEVTAVPSIKEAYPTGSASESVGSEIVSLSTATVIPVPYSTGAPYGNATISSTKKKCSSVFPSGYVSSKTAEAVPTGSYPAGYPSGSSKPSGVAVPTGGYPAEYPSSSGKPSGVAIPTGGYSSEYPAPSSSSTAAGVPVPSSSAPAGYAAAYPTY